MYASDTCTCNNYILCVCVYVQGDTKLLFTFYADPQTFSQSLETWSVTKQRTSSPCGESSGINPPVTTLLQTALTVDEISSYQEIAVAVRSLMEWYVRRIAYHVQLSL